MEGIALLVQEVKKIEDWRKNRGKRYELFNILAIAVLAILSGADDYVALSEYCKSKKDFLLKHGLIDGVHFPSHDLFRLVLQALDKDQFAKLLATWLSRAVSEKEEWEIPDEFPEKMIHIDGKSLRATRKSTEHSRSALQIVTAYCSNNAISIGQAIIDKKSCEKAAIPKLLKIIDIKGCVVTIDAVASYKKNAAIIIDAGADYLLALKKNNKHLFLEVEGFFTHFEHTSLITDFFESEEKGHGREEKRTCQVISDLSYFPDLDEWKEVQSLVCITSQRKLNGKTSTEKRYYITSLAPNATALAKAIRRHWTVENNLHWSLDVAFNEDLCRIKHKQAAANFAALRRFSLALRKNAKLSKVGIKNQRLKAAWSDDFLEKLFLFFLHVCQKVIN